MSGRSRRLAQQHRQRTRRRAAVAVGAVVLLVVLTLVTVSSLDDGEPVSGAATVSMVEMAFVPDPVEVPVADARLRLVNDGEVPHSFVVTELGKGSPDVEPGEVFILDLTDQDPGTYAVICDLPGHREAGMETTLILG